MTERQKDTTIVTKVSSGGGSSVGLIESRSISISTGNAKNVEVCRNRLFRTAEVMMAKYLI